jgi:uncharacterized SAM-binding protein YcdF (DUF218 family)
LIPALGEAVFFVLAKLLWFVLQPSSLMIGCVIAGTFLASTTWKRLSRGLLWGGALALLIGGISPLGDALIRPLEYRFQRPDLDRVGSSIAGIIVLGGGEDGQAIGSPQLAALNEAAERYTEAVALARRLPGARLIFSGGSGRLLTIEEPEAEGAGRLFEALGIPKDRITLEMKSRDTYENALFTARMLKPTPNQRWLLITSAWHMPRAVGCFRQAGFSVEPWPVDYRTPRRLDMTRIYSSIPEGLRRIDFVTREYVGLAAYYLSGRTGSLLPGPGA